ncbi:MAG: hypothetical protein KC912_07120 [Proteobacteria bacterium]|nr:hypothetical protein [Pseudomonadota bacterium]
MSSPAHGQPVVEPEVAVDSPSPAEVAPEPEAQIFEAAPAVFALDEATRITRVRTTFVDLEELRFRRTQRAATGQFIAAAVELGIGGLAIAGSDPEAGLQAGFGTALVAGGVLHGLGAWAQINVSNRRHARFGRQLVEIDGEPLETLLLRTDDHALQLERTARTHSFATGLNVGLLGAGLLTAFFAPNAEGEDLGLGMAMVGLSGSVHHALRWRSTVRLGTDFRTLRRQVP